MTTLYKICPSALWRAAEQAGVFRGSEHDIRDGFIHFSTADQVAETAVRHFDGQADLLLISVATDALGDALKWERARGGALFPHLYGDLALAAVTEVAALPRGADGCHIFPPLKP